jgi:hypothetical protein
MVETRALRRQSMGLPAKEEASKRGTRTKGIEAINDSDGQWSGAKKREEGRPGRTRARGRFASHSINHIPSF